MAAADLRLPYNSIGSTLLCFLFLTISCAFTICVSPVSARRHPPEGPDSFTFYIHNRVYNPAVNNSVFDSVYSAGPFNFSQPNPYSFGGRSTFEDPITADPSPESEPIGVAQGFWIMTSQRELVLMHVFTATVTSWPYTGTVSIMGQITEAASTRTLTVIGGTGDFLAARGYAVNKVVTMDRTAPANWTLSFDLDLYY